MLSRTEYAGITRGPDNTLWQASSTGGEANHWEWDADFILHKLDSVKLCVRPVELTS